MKNILISLLVLISVSANCQDFEDVVWPDGVYKYTGGGYEWFQDSPEVAITKLLILYEKECYDTIEATPFMDEFIINHGSYKEMVSIEQLEKRGYIFSYRFITDMNGMEFTWIYYFVKQPTFKDFIKWLKTK